MSTEAVIVTELKGDVLEVRLNRPDSYNAIDAALRDQLVEAFDSAVGTGARAVLLTGNGRGFCGGLDLKALAAPGPGYATSEFMRRSTQRLVVSFLACPLPVVTAVHGAVAGIGLTLALGADVCVAAAGARFVPAFVERAIVPDGATAFLLPRIIGMARTKDLLMRGRSMTAEQAAAMGLVSECVPEDELVTHARNIAVELAQLPTVTLALLKQLLSQSFESDLAATLLSERTAQGLAAATADAHEGRQAFQERRSATFLGR